MKTDEEYLQLAEKYESLQKLPREKVPSWRKRCCYLLAGAKRSLAYVAENEMGVTQDDPDFPKAISSLKNLSSKHEWVMWSQLFDIEEQSIKLEKRQNKFDELEDVELKMLEIVIKSLSKFIAEFVRNPVKKDGDEYSLMSKIDLYNKILSAFDKADVILRRLTGQPLEYTRIDSNNVIDVKAKVSEVKTLKDEEAEAEEYFKKLESEMK
ncbi:MAG: hypothetical protein IJH12_02010 [Clostridia bacterium]|nr:hypothetical protein [Clostridia bacterium]